MAGGAGYRAIGGQAAIEKQFLAKGDLLRRLWIVLRDNLRVSSTGRPTWLRDLGLARGPALGIGGGFPVVCSLLPTMSAMPVATTTARRPHAVCFRKGMAGSDLLVFLGLEPIANCAETRLTLREILSWHPRRLTLITSLE